MILQSFFLFPFLQLRFPDLVEILPQACDLGKILLCGPEARGLRSFEIGSGAVVILITQHQQQSPCIVAFGNPVRGLHAPQLPLGADEIASFEG